MSKLVKVLAIVVIVAGAAQILLGGATYYLVQRELADEKIVVSDDADNFAGEPVEGPLTAYSEAMVIKEHAAEIADGQTYAQLDQDDPRRADGDDRLVPPRLVVHLGRRLRGGGAGRGARGACSSSSASPCSTSTSGSASWRSPASHRSTRRTMSTRSNLHRNHTRNHLHRPDELS